MKKTLKKKLSGKKKSPVRKVAVKAAPRKRQISDSARDLALFCADLIEAKRGFDVTILNVSKDLQITDYFVICSGRNKKQNQAIAYTFLDNYSKLAKYGCSKPSYNSMQGFEEGQWIVVDLGAVVVHIFSEQLRQYYDLEFLWSSAPKVKRK
ncbi:MAG: ribosome silencing factor [Planctomycetes bacterium]|nr:ribosome silencing factor [Planctomycetota bacterium]